MKEIPQSHSADQLKEEPQNIYNNKTSIRQ